MVYLNDEHFDIVDFDDDKENTDNENPRGRGSDLKQFDVNLQPSSLPSKGFPPSTEKGSPPTTERFLKMIQDEQEKLQHLERNWKSMLTMAKEKTLRSWLKSYPPGLTNLTNTDLEAENVPGLHKQKTQQASMKGRKRGSSELEERLQPMVGGA